MSLGHICPCSAGKYAHPYTVHPPIGSGVSPPEFFTCIFYLVIRRLPLEGLSQFTLIGKILKTCPRVSQLLVEFFFFIDAF